MISGTVWNAALSETFTVKVVDSYGVSATQSLTITVNPLPLITVTPLATATDGQTGYSQTLAATGGTTPYTWSITSGVIPTGLTLGSTSGVISGTVAGTAVTETFTVQLTDVDNVSASLPFTLTVNAAPNITTTSLPAGTRTAAYSQTLAATGGTTSAHLDGFNGDIADRSYPRRDHGRHQRHYWVRHGERDLHGHGQRCQRCIRYAGRLPSRSTWLPPSPPRRCRERRRPGPTTRPWPSTGGTAPFTWSITAGVLPSGLSLNTSSGVITGTVANTAVNETFTVKVADSYGVSATQSLTITVNGAPTVTTATLPGATKTGAYSQTLAATGGTTPYAWSLSGGILPTGLALSSGGIISGTVGTTAATRDIHRSGDGCGWRDRYARSLSITVNAVPDITTTTLPGGDKRRHLFTDSLCHRWNHPQRWSVSVGNLPAGPWNQRLDRRHKRDGQQSFGTNGKYTFTVKVTDANGVSDTQQLSIMIS